jgi:RCC1 and BTB domain-containing protein
LLSLAATGEVYTWGEGKFGRLGHGDESNRALPSRVAALRGVKIVLVSCGGFHTAAVADAGEAFSWGGGEHGQLGHGDKLNKLEPCRVLALEGVSISFVSCGWSHTVALSGCVAFVNHSVCLLWLLFSYVVAHRRCWSGFHLGKW